jgi:hypothetical protein
MDSAKDADRHPYDQGVRRTAGHESNILAAEKPTIREMINRGEIPFITDQRVSGTCDAGIWSKTSRYVGATPGLCHGFAMILRRSPLKRLGKRRFLRFSTVLVSVTERRGILLEWCVADQIASCLLGRCGQGNEAPCGRCRRLPGRWSSAIKL